MGSPNEARFRRPGIGMEERDAGAFLTPWAGSGKGSRLPLPSRPPGGDPRARRPGLTHRQRPAARPRRVRRPQTPGARPLPPRPVPVTCPPGSDPRPRQRGPDKGRWTSRRKVSSEERGGTGRGGAGEAGRKRAGRGRGEEGCREEGWGGAEA